MKKLTLIITILTAIGITSCKKGFLDETVNPNAPLSNTLPLALSSNEKGAADIVNGWNSYTYPSVGYAWLYGPYAVWEGYWVESPNGYVSDNRLTQYTILTTSLGFPWTDLYDNLSNVNLMQVSATQQNNPDYEAIALVLKAYGFEQLVDNFNNVPYSQAFQGGSGNLTPAYDSGASIYADLIKQMDNAISLINKNAAAAIPVAGPSTDDIIFGGNMTSWKKFANTMKLRLIMRQSNTAGFAALKAELSSTEAEGYLDGTTQALANPGYTLSDAYNGQESPFYLMYGNKPNGSTTLYGNSYWLANAFCVGLMNSLTDTARLVRFYQTVDGSTNPAMVIGAVLGSPNPPSAISSIGPGLLGDTPTAGASKSAVLFSGAESLFLQAEAASDGMITGDPNALYNAGITASFESLGLTDAQALAYYSQPTVALATANPGNNQKSIIIQKYIALNGYGNFEAYNEYRRTGYPAVPRSLNPGAEGASTGGASGIGQLPSIVFYPQIEYSTNPVNVGKQPAATISTEFNQKIFWAK
ncbi:SusD/RagB family nutrient-binding outer membrane lipoprotein [Mucilaginibacter sp. E4BP6]|uniref:SusD/RagB family nutrient-binding outer membrane lipoprotein n=1 Tax=Mucilaginibacter sp. E4BP6 TaxID=2723089 RepID=UPI0015CE53D5|nr:SusD/RagB family nutrient-binding outer membrane lipoprotein [Mucilaginibacter sp. E4BP6]NYE67376.1 hypothetical protein [Mucilaginibacter sp. E4BP6]